MNEPERDSERKPFVASDHPDAAEGPLAERIEASLDDYPDFPKPGVLFRDVAPVLADASLLEEIVRQLARHAEQAGAKKIAGIESRGFLLGVPIALELGLPFVPVRKEGKLPGETVHATYHLEYGTARLELQRKSVARGDRYYLVDDLLATGGTLVTAGSLLEGQGADVVGIGVMIDLAALNGRQALDGYNLLSLLTL